MSEQVINYQEHRDTLDIRNLDALPAGTGAKYLLTIKGQRDALIAKQWKRKRPSKLQSNEVLVCF